MPLISVIVLNWNGCHLLDDCLAALAGQNFRDFETILVDNGSMDGSAAHVRERYPWVRLIELPSNAGFAEGNNLGFRDASGRFIVTLNNDTKVAPVFLEEAVTPVLADSCVGMVATKMINYHEPGRIDSVGIKVTSNGMGVNIGVGEQDRGQYDTPAEVFGPCAGAALYRRKMLEEVGFFDPDFFAYYEDLDLAWRGRLAGWRCVTAPRAVVQHIHSATSGRMSPFTVYQVQRNKWYTIVKNWPGRLLLKHFPRIIWYDLGSLALAALRGKIGASLRSRLHVLRDLPLLLRKRREIQALRKVRVSDVALFLESGGSPLQTFKRKMREGV